MLTKNAGLWDGVRSKRAALLWGIVVADLLLAIGAPFLNNFLALAAATSGIAVITLTGLIAYGTGPEGVPSPEVMRDAIAAAFVLVYLILVAMTVFTFRVQVDPSTGALIPLQADPVATALLSNFTTLAGVVVAFYFGTSAYVAVATKRSTPPAQPAGGGGAQ
jgi:hypothetical protein